MSEQQISNRGLEAGQILASQAYIDAMDALRQSIVAKWKECGLRDEEGQRITLQMMKLADTFEGILGGYVEAGKFAARQLELDALREQKDSVGRRILRKVL